MFAAPIMLHPDAIPVGGTPVIIFRTESRTRGKQMGKFLRAYFINRKRSIAILEEFYFIIGKNILTDRIIQGNNALGKTPMTAQGECQQTDIRDPVYPNREHAQRYGNPSKHPRLQGRHFLSAITGIQGRGIRGGFCNCNTCSASCSSIGEAAGPSTSGN